MKAFQLLFVTFTALAGCAKNQAKPVYTHLADTIKQNMPAADSLTYIALGDSYTIGEAVAQNQSFPYQLTALLNAGVTPVATPKIIAVTGWTTDNLISAIASSGVTTKKYSFVTLLIGVNDQFQGLSQDNYKVKFAQVLNTAINFADGDTSRVFVLSIPDYGVTPFAGGNDASIGPQIDQFNSINEQISRAAHVNYTDITAISRQAATNPTLIAPDGLHPSGKMYGLWMQLLAPKVAAALKK